MLNVMCTVISKEHSNTNSIMDQLLDICEESGRGCRNKKKLVDPSCCPICSVTLRVTELNCHLGMEIDKLSKLNVYKQRRNLKSSLAMSGPSKLSDVSKKNWETYQKVKANRQGRLKVKSKKRKTNEITCPVCNKFTSDDITLHVEMCLQRMDTNESLSDDENIDVEGEDGKFEEYEWAGQTRVRASSLLEGGFTGLGIGTSIVKSTAEEEDVDVIIDGDDTQVYGSTHYTEQDIINASTDNSTQNMHIPVASDNDEANNLEEISKSVVIDSLKMKIRELENYEETKELYKCLICMGRYNTPVVSVCCWHVHCEQCWLKTLATKKICPQCNMITSPTELRRIYI